MFRRFMIVCWVLFGLATALAIVSGCGGSAVPDQAAIDPVIQAAPRAPMEGRTPEDRLLVIYGLDEQKGLIDTQGRIVVEPRFDWARSSSEGRAMVRRNARSGFVDGTGRFFWLIGMTACGLTAMTAPLLPAPLILIVEVGPIVLRLVWTGSFF